MIEYEDFRAEWENKAIFYELSKTLDKLELDELGRCQYCAKIMDKNID